MNDIRNNENFGGAPAQRAASPQGGSTLPQSKALRADWVALLREPRVVSVDEWLSEGVVGDVVGVDFETYYTGAYSVSKLGTWGYCQDPRFDAYLVAVADREKVCVCRPEEFPWASIAGLDWVSHNREFDRYVFEALTEAQSHGDWVTTEGTEDTESGAQDEGVVPQGTAGATAWFCSAAVCAFLQLPRDLAGAVEAVFGFELDKSVRAKARRPDKGYGIKDKGVIGQLSLVMGGEDIAIALQAELGPGEDPEMVLYAARDAVACLGLWDRLGDKWPAWERELFEATCAMGRRGVAMDWGYVEKCRKQMESMVAELKSGLPWVPALSLKKFGEACEESGIPVPSSTGVDDSGFLAWWESYGKSEAGKWVETMQRIRSANRTEKVLASMLARRPSAAWSKEHGAGSKKGDRMIYEVKYCGANTGRWSGGGGLNMQNLNRSEAEGVDLRRAIVAPPGFVLGVVDFAQIEARMLLYLAGDHEALGMLRGNPEMDVYEMHARVTLGYGRQDTGDGKYEEGKRTSNVELPTSNVEGESLKAFCARTGSGLRQLAKARVLGLGFGCGPEKFVSVAKSMAGLEISLEESKRIVGEYRESNPKVVSLWRRLENACRAKMGGDYVLPLPCTQWDRSLGRFLIYRDVHSRGREIRCVVGGQECTVYGGLLAENFTQAAARDVLGFAWLRCVAAGFDPVLSVHDELVFELPEESAEADLARIIGIMEEPVEWAPGLPLQAEGSLMNFYKK